MEGYFVEHNGDCWQSVFPSAESAKSQLHIRYLHVDLSKTTNGRDFARVAWISKQGRVYADMPDATCASGWRARMVEVA